MESKTMKNKKLLLATVAYATFASNAYAFDEVNWTWNSDVTSTIAHDVNITIDATPSGLIQVENIQTQTGDVTANSTVSGIHNEAGSSDGTFTFDETIDLTAAFDDNGEGNPITSVTINSGDLTASNGSGNVDNNAEEINMTFDLEGEVQLEAAALDAVDLPMIESNATAVGNNYAVDGTVSIALDSEQSILGDTTATSSVSDILNAAVDSSATAVGNNMAVTLADAAPGDEVAIADITQLSTGAVSATSSVTDVTLVNYTNFGGADMGGLAETQIPVISSAATAVGNNLAITVGGPSVAPGL